MIKIISIIIFFVLLLPLLIQSGDAESKTGIMASVTIKSNNHQTQDYTGDAENSNSDSIVKSTPQEQDNNDSSNESDHATTDEDDYTGTSNELGHSITDIDDDIGSGNVEPTTMKGHYEDTMNAKGNDDDKMDKNEIKYTTAESGKLPLFIIETLGVPVAATITGSVATAWMIGNTGVASSFNLKPVGFSAVALKSYAVARRYQALFRKTQMLLALAFGSLASGSIMDFFDVEIASYILYSAFYGLIAYHLRVWYSTTSYSRVTKEIQQFLIILPILGLLGYSYLLATEGIQHNTFQVITVIGFLAITPLAIFTSLAYRGSRIYRKWILFTTGLSIVMAGLVLSSIVWIGDILILLGCGSVIIAQTILSTKFAVAKN